MLADSAFDICITTDVSNADANQLLVFIMHSLYR